MCKKSINAVAISLITGIVLCVNIADAKEHIVYANAGKARDMRFDPQDITIAKGDTVTWVNNSSVYHNVKAVQKDIPQGEKPFTSKGLKEKGDRWSYQFNGAGKYNYFCVPHRSMGMVGSITVTDIQQGERK